MWRGDHGYAKFYVIRNKPHTSDKRPRGEMPKCRGQRESDEVLVKALDLNEEGESDEPMLIITTARHRYSERGQFWPPSSGFLILI